MAEIRWDRVMLAALFDVLRERDCVFIVHRIGQYECEAWPEERSRSSALRGAWRYWELFSLYVKALRKFKPRYFLYENVKSMSQAIREEITRLLGVEPTLINSNLVSAQYRERLYWTNIPNVSQTQDRRITLKDILKKPLRLRPVGKRSKAKERLCSRPKRATV